MSSLDLLERFGPREAMDYDVVIVGGGPAGLVTAIRVKQLKPDASVVVLEKGRRAGRAHPVRRGDGPASADRTSAGLEGARRAAAPAGDRSAVANRLPGSGTVYLGQQMRFRAPVPPGDTVHATVSDPGQAGHRRRLQPDRPTVAATCTC